MNEEIKPNSAKEARAKARAEAQKAAADLAAKRKELKTNIGKTFVDGETTVTVTGFEPDKCLGPEQEDAFLVNFGNPNANHFIFCGEFLTQYKLKE